MKKLEKDIRKEILDYLNNLPDCFAFRIEQRPGLSRGVSDIIAVRDGKAIFIEVKRPGNKPTALQKRFLRNVQGAGALAFMAYSLNDVTEEIE